jgi:Sulfotransferase domain
VRDLRQSGRGRLEEGARVVWRRLERYLPNRVAGALKRPASALLRRSPPVPKRRVAPHLERQRDGRVVLVEGERARLVSSDEARRALESTLGPVHTPSAAHTTSPANGAIAVELVTPPELEALVAQTAPGTMIVAASSIPVEAGDGRTVQYLALDAPPASGGDVGRGTGPLDTVAIARVRGASFFLVAAAERQWLLRQAELLDFLARRGSVAAVNTAGTLWSLPPPPQPGDAKIFVIGLGKTGTTSVNRALRQLGVRSFHWGGRAAYHSVLQAQRDGERLLRHVGERYDAYDDIEPLSVRFDLADLQYPGSRFILTVRNVEDWIASRHRHADRNLRKQRTGSYAGSNVGRNEDVWRAQWDTHRDRVTRWFADRDDLLVIDVCGGEGWERLAPFLGHAVPDVPFPFENAGD